MKSILMALAVLMIFGIGCTQQGQLVGNDTDPHGCIPSAGYTWCDAKQKCIWPWEENCTFQGNQSLYGQALTYCSTPNVANIYICGEYVQVVSSLIGGGSSFYLNGSLAAQCPVVAPSSESDECKLLLHGNNCVEQEVICSAMPGSDKDANGCIPSAGYTWCPMKQKCIRSFEESCN
jgi:hypothetical protein